MEMAQKICLFPINVSFIAISVQILMATILLIPRNSSIIPLTFIHSDGGDFEYRETKTMSKPIEKPSAASYISPKFLQPRCSLLDWAASLY